MLRVRIDEVRPTAELRAAQHALADEACLLQRALFGDVLDVGRSLHPLRVGCREVDRWQRVDAPEPDQTPSRIAAVASSAPPRRASGLRIIDGPRAELGPNSTDAQWCAWQESNLLPHAPQAWPVSALQSATPTNLMSIEISY
jgi:hypothetical protein